MSRALEAGDVFFFYRPRVRVETVRSLEDAQRFFVVLEPDRRRLVRRLVVGRKRLPDVLGHERAWAFVADVATDPQALRDELGPDVRPVGEGRYAIVEHEGHTHLAYVLELPPRPGEAQRVFGIHEQASYVIAVRNPDAPAPRGTGLPPSRRPDYPEPLLERFGGRRFAAVDPPEFLDHPGAEVVIIGAAVDAESELGIELDAEAEQLEDADLFRRLRLPRDELALEPLERGELR